MIERAIPRLTAEHRKAFIEAVGMLETCGKGGGPVRYKPRGRSELGVDCIGVPEWGIRKLGFQVIGDSTNYPLRPDGKTLRDLIVKNLGEPIGRAFARAGDIVLMRWSDNKRERIRYFNHVGVLMPLSYPPEKGLVDPLAKFSLLHAYIRYPAVIRHEISNPWDRRIIEVYSLTGRSA